MQSIDSESADKPKCNERRVILLGNRSASTSVERRFRRTNRRTFVVEVLLIFGLILLTEFVFEQLGVSHMWVDIGMAVLLLFLIGRAFAGRSHDLGRNDAWTILPLAVFAGGWLVVLFWHEAPLAVEMISHLAWASALVTVALLRGNKGKNKFGSAPEDAVELKVIANVG